MLYKEKKNLTSINDIPEIIVNDIRRQMRDVIEFETELAEVTIPATQQRDGENRLVSLHFYYQGTHFLVQFQP